jgi:hypothetical protein
MKLLRNMLIVTFAALAIGSCKCMRASGDCCGTCQMEAAAECCGTCQTDAAAECPGTCAEGAACCAEKSGSGK